VGDCLFGGGVHNIAETSVGKIFNLIPIVLVVNKVRDNLRDLIRSYLKNNIRL